MFFISLKNPFPFISLEYFCSIQTLLSWPSNWKNGKFQMECCFIGCYNSVQLSEYILSRYMMPVTIWHIKCCSLVCMFFLQWSDCSWASHSIEEVHVHATLIYSSTNLTFNSTSVVPFYCCIMGYYIWVLPKDSFKKFKLFKSLNAKMNVGFKM